MFWVCASKFAKLWNFWNETSVDINGVQAFQSKFRTCTNIYIRAPSYSGRTWKCTFGLARVLASKPFHEASRVTVPEAPRYLDDNNIADSSAMRMARVRSLRGMPNLPADTGRPIPKALPSTKTSETSKGTSKKPSQKK